ncbi:MAG: DUF1566 domain-containing protein [Nitrospirae bacterium]|nr:DUF1566 domain-containing protein [Nitrospirota bacterium]
MARKFYLVISTILIFISTAHAYDAQTWKTGQQGSYDSNNPQRDDGALNRGVAWPSPRFADNGDGTVTDNLTSLTWTKNANLAGTTWQGALDYVASMNTGPGTYGYTDWRLPNKEELFSLVDFSNHNPALPTGNPFINVQSGWYWSSTTNAGGTDNAWTVGMLNGYVNNDNKSYGGHYVWPVRAGQVGNSGCPQATLSSALELYIPNLQYTPATGASMNMRVNMDYRQIGNDYCFKLTSYGVNQVNSTSGGCPQATLSSALELYIPNLQYTPATGSLMNMWVNMDFRQIGNDYCFKLTSYGVNP